MQKSVRLAKKLTLYVLRLGPYSGIASYVRLHHSTRPLVRQRVGAVDFLLRPKSADVGCFQEVFIDRDYDLDIDLTCPKLIIDAGAHIGLASLFFSAKYPGARVKALEPIESNYALLRDNTKFNADIETVPKALWCNNDPLYLRNPDAPSWSYRLDRGGVEGGRLHAPIATTTIEELAPSDAVPEIDLVKLDIEGSEFGVLSHNQQWLNRTRFLIVEIHHRIDKIAALRAEDELRRMGFHLRHKGANTICSRATE